MAGDAPATDGTYSMNGEMHGSAADMSRGDINRGSQGYGADDPRTMGRDGSQSARSGGSIIVLPAGVSPEAFIERLMEEGGRTSR
ncbi:hypothetical protein [Tropicimonas sp. IMCC34011]|uniref:hypothetical protein n=1 Tax=Tropicimonas sp. IMCC34011 TaxID=2248759 RepID=UPI000E28574A|nr:hypothetical protein [Tropicimonas sp. IMCC34011]